MRHESSMRATLCSRIIMSTAATVSIAETCAVSNHFPLRQYAPYPTRRSLPAVWMRSGTSKGLFIHRRDLPERIEQWGPILLSAMGSSNAGGRQLDGIGGATSTTSKVAVVAKSTRPGIDVDYTFVQVAPDQAKVDMTGNCGNIASGVGPFSLDEGLLRVEAGQSEVRKVLDIHVYLRVDWTSDRRQDFQHKHSANDLGNHPAVAGGQA